MPQCYLPSDTEVKVSWAWGPLLLTALRVLDREVRAEKLRTMRSSKAQALGQVSLAAKGTVGSNQDKCAPNKLPC